MSPDLADLRGIFTNILLPLSFHCHQPLSELLPVGYKILVYYHFYLKLKCRYEFLFLDSEITFSWNPVCSSIST